MEQKADVEMLEGGDFWLAIDFENLSRRELELLSYAVRLHQGFRHKLGYGKPLGLGKVRLDPAGLFLVNRQACYTSDRLDAARYVAAWRAEGMTDWPQRFHAEASATGTNPCPSPADWAAVWSARVAGEAPALAEMLRALELLGDPSRAPGNVPVHYPQPLCRAGQVIQPNSPAMEDKGYEWFQHNQAAAGQYLRSLDSANTGGFTRLPTLDRNPRTAPPSPPAPAGPTVGPPAGPLEAHGRVLDFLLSERKSKGKPVFTITLGGVSYRGFVTPNDALKLQGVSLGQTVKLKVVNFNASTFQLTLPSAP